MLRFCAATLLLLCLGIAPTKADESPWCLRGDRGGEAVVFDCQYASYEACRQSMYLYGPTSMCLPNVNYRPPAVTPRPKRTFR